MRRLHDPLEHPSAFLTKVLSARAAVGQRSTGLRMVNGGAPLVVHRSALRFAAWLRTEFSFPVRVPVYLLGAHRLRLRNNSLATASFFYPDDPTENPYIRVAAGDYFQERRHRSRDDCLSSYLHSIAHEVHHYQQWLRTGEITERVVVSAARRMVDAYAQTVDHP